METELKQHDRPRYTCSLFVPQPKRAALQAVLAWNLEVAKIAETVSEPMLGHIRYTWWRETLEALFAGNPRRHPVVEALAPWVSHLTHAHFETIIDARAQALEASVDAVPYAEATGGTLNLLCAEAMGITDEAVKQYAFDVGVDYALAGSSSPRRRGSIREKTKRIDSRLRGSDGVIFFHKQAIIADYWAKHPESAARARLPLSLVVRLMF